MAPVASSGSSLSDVAVAAEVEPNVDMVVEDAPHAERDEKERASAGASLGSISPVAARSGARLSVV